MTNRFPSHPTDAISRFAAPDLTYNDLVLQYEDILLGSEDVAWRYGALQALTSAAIACVELFERQRQLSQPDPKHRGVSAITAPFPSHANAPAKGSAATSAAQELKAREDVRPLGNVVALRRLGKPSGAA